MKNLIPLTTFLCLFIQINAQPAPDFTVTDSNGAQHTLYADYLNQGKTVVIDFFFTYCPPCNAMAPLLEPFYQEWGGGAADVEFIALSIFLTDENAAVANYLAGHGHTYPGVGGDGGSVDAVQTYLDNTWGAFESTHTFAVISPYGSVNFDVRGANFGGTIDALEEAIRSTGARKPYTLSGAVTKPNGSPISNYNILINGEMYTPDVIDAGGIFALDVLFKPDSAYTISILRSNDDYNEGLTTFDVIKLRKHILTIDIFDAPWKYLAMDANKDSQLAGLDLILLSKLVLYVQNDLPNNDSWGFYKTGYTFQMPENPYAEMYNGSAGNFTFTAGSSATLDFTGFKIGDFNQSASAD